jgi:hypothetical protein
MNSVPSATVVGEAIDLLKNLRTLPYLACQMSWFMTIDLYGGGYEVEIDGTW